MQHQIRQNTAVKQAAKRLQITPNIRFIINMLIRNDYRRLDSILDLFHHCGLCRVFMRLTRLQRANIISYTAPVGLLRPIFILLRHSMQVSVYARNVSVSSRRCYHRTTPEITQKNSWKSVLFFTVEIINRRKRGHNFLLGKKEILHDVCLA